MFLHRFWQQRAPLHRILSMILDAIVLVAFCCLLYVLLGGQVHWKTSLFRVSMANVSGPLKVVASAMVIKEVLRLNMGILASLSRKLLPVIGSFFSAFYRREFVIIQWFIINKLNIACSVISLLLSLTFLECYLRYFPHTLPYALGNYVTYGYDTGLSGIYRYNAEMKMELMRPNYKRRMYFNGRYWHHQTDAMGFRNPTNRSSAYVVLLGDSMIYGHGVEETSTIRHHLENILQKPVANLGIQGSSIHQEYQVLKRFGVGLNPHFVFLFFLVNDIRDLVNQMSDEEMQRFLSFPVDDHVSPYYAIPKITYESYALSAYLRELYVVRAFDFFLKYTRMHLINHAIAFGNSWQSVPFFQENPRFLWAMRFHLRALRKIQNLAEKNHFHFVNVFIYTGVSYPDKEEIYEDILEPYCKVHGIHFYNLKDDISLAMARGEELFLKHDGHFTDQGARLVARALARLIQN
jgi:hypothetical protein